MLFFTMNLKNKKNSYLFYFIFYYKLALRYRSVFLICLNYAKKIKKLSIKLKICNKITNNFGIMSHLDEQNS